MTGSDIWATNPEHWLAAIVESSEDAIVGKTLDSVIRSWNRGAAQIFGYAREEIVGQSIHVLIPPERQDEENDIVCRLSRGEQIKHFETVRLRKDGSRVDVSLSVSPIRDDTGAIVGAAKIARDVSEATVLRRAAEDAHRAKSEFLATMSHELRTPLNAIAGYVDLMELGLYGPLTEQQCTHLSRIKANQHTLVRLIDEVLDLAKLESGRADYHLADFPIDDLLRTLEAFIAPTLQQTGIAYHFESCRPALRAYADRDKTEQIMLNLLSNALKFTAEGEIRVRCHDDDGWLNIQVSDTGRGIRKELLGRIFEPFVRDDQESRATQGTGLGLSISRRLARDMGGDVLAASRPGKGSTFTLVLPKAKR